MEKELKRVLDSHSMMCMYKPPEDELGAIMYKLLMANTELLLTFINKTEEQPKGSVVINHYYGDQMEDMGR